MPKVQVNLGYACPDTQSAIDAGLNGFAVILMAESFGDHMERFPRGGIMFRSHDHSRRPIYVIVSEEMPVEVKEESMTPAQSPPEPAEDIRELLPLAIEIAAEYHGKTMNKDGTPYILHPLRLMMEAARLGYGYKEQVVAVLHDTIEDTDLTLDRLRELGFPPAILAALDCLTKRPEETEAGDTGYEAFIQRCGYFPETARVKLLDLYDNMDVRRLPEMGEWEQRRTAKYHRAMLYLKERLREMENDK